MTEEDTIKALRRVSRERAQALYIEYYEEGMNSTTTVTLGDVMDYSNARLEQHGWFMTSERNLVQR